MNPWIEIRTGSDSDLPKIKGAFAFLDAAGVPYSPHILSAHRTPTLMAERARGLEQAGFKVSLAAAGGSAHLPGMTASETVLPVVGVPVETQNLGGLDSLYSIIQMPDGIPVGCVGIGQAESAAILAAQIAALGNAAVQNRIRRHRRLPGESLSRKPQACVGILRPRSVRPPYERYVDALKHLKLFGIEPLEHTIRKVDAPGVRASCGQIEHEGAAVILVLCDAASIRLPQMVSAATHLPVIGVPFAEGRIDGKSGRPKDDLLSRLLASYDRKSQASGFPVAGMGFNRIKNGVIYAAQILGVHLHTVRDKVRSYREGLARESERKNAMLGELGAAEYLRWMQKSQP